MHGDWLLYIIDCRHRFSLGRVGVLRWCCFCCFTKIMMFLLHILRKRDRMVVSVCCCWMFDDSFDVLCVNMIKVFEKSICFWSSIWICFKNFLILYVPIEIKKSEIALISQESRDNLNAKQRTLEDFHLYRLSGASRVFSKVYKFSRFINLFSLQ